MGAPLVSGEPTPPRVALTIAGSDSGGGAGIQADLKTFEAFGVWGTSAITGVTAQNTVGVDDALVLPPSLVTAQIAAVAGDFGVSAAKTGMLGSSAVIEAVAETISGLAIGPLVVDPVLVTSHGDVLLEPQAVGVLCQALLPLAALVTPNLPEAEALLGHPVEGTDGMAAAAEEVGQFGPAAVLIKGGHLGSDRAPDLLWVGGVTTWLDGPRIPGRYNHGTGCTLSAAICAQLARGAELAAACWRAKQFVAGAIAHGVPVGRGVGPVDPGWCRNSLNIEAQDLPPDMPNNTAM
jgi:hydroxymethylpyrimidine/phosphomethylpyrimidine kinase